LPVIDLPAGWDEFLAGLSPSVHKNFQYYRRRLQGEGMSEIITNSADLPAAWLISAGCTTPGGVRKSRPESSQPGPEPLL
jgi:hypothetical protein